MSLRTAIAGSLAACAMLGLTACSGYDVQLEGGVFDLIGVSDLGKPKPEPKVAERNGLVVPPTTAALPVPGSVPQRPPQIAGVNGDQSWPVDPDARRVENKQVLLKQQTAFCEKARQRFENGLDAVLASGPLGSCEQSVIKNFTGKGLYEKNGANKAATY